MHSPFVFNFILQVLRKKVEHPSISIIEKKRKEYLQSTAWISVEDLGAGSRSINHTKRRVRDIAKSSLKPTKYASLLYKLVEYYQPNTVIELGTSLGITTAYLSLPGKKVYSIEGSNAIASIAEKTFRDLSIQNIELIKGNFDSCLPTLLQQVQKVDMVYVDGNHRKEPTLRYFKMLLEGVHDESIFIFDDIHWSSEMELAWQEIQQHPSVTSTIDLFFIGIVFFRKDFLVKQHHTIRY